MIQEKEQELKRGIELLLEISEPQPNCFIGSFSLVKDWKDWRSGIEANFEGSKEDFKILSYTLDFFKENVKGEIISEGKLLDDYGDVIEEIGGEIDDLIEVSTEIEKLDNTYIDYPPNTTHFQLLPVDYNRGTDDITIVFLTSLGEKYFGDHLTGDY